MQTKYSGASKNSDFRVVARKHRAPLVIENGRSLHAVNEHLRKPSLVFALRAILRMFKIVPYDFVSTELPSLNKYGPRREKCIFRGAHSIIRDTKYHSIYVIIVASLLMSSCASVPEFSTLSYARNAVISVSRGHHELDAANAVKAAQIRISLAQQALNEQDAEQAERYAQEAIANAEYAQALTRASQARMDFNQLQSTFENLQHELEWREPLNLNPLP